MLAQSTGRPPNEFRILSLDGGGSKGVYTLGILKEVEAIAGSPLCEQFDLIYGTSTGAIIAAMLAQGNRVDEIKSQYFKLIPDVMDHWFKSRRSAALKIHANKIFANRKFSDFKTGVGIVSTHVGDTKPLIFKSDKQQAHGLAATFEPGFGCTITEAVLASCAAFPLFELQKVRMANQGHPTLADGGFSANNPTMLAIADGLRAYKRPASELRVLSLGVGSYREPKRNLAHRIIFRLPAPRNLVRMLETSSKTVEQLRRILLPDIETVRIDDAFTDQMYETDLMEFNLDKLTTLNELGRASFGRQENAVKKLFGWL